MPGFSMFFLSENTAFIASLCVSIYLPGVRMKDAPHLHLVRFHPFHSTFEEASIPLLRDSYRLYFHPFLQQNIGMPLSTSQPAGESEYGTVVPSCRNKPESLSWAADGGSGIGVLFVNKSPT